jgi:chloramphenicol-sensitive protein RarD
MCVAQDSASSSPRFSEPFLGFAAAVIAFGSWGFLPLYFYLVGPQVSAWEILDHRIIWTALMLGATVLALGRGARVWAAFTHWRLLGPLMISAVLVTLNWGSFIWAVTHNYVIETSLGYYIAPLLNVALGFVFLGERPRRLQWLAIAIAASGVLYMLITYGNLPWVALMPAFCFGFYGLVRKQLDVDSMTGLLVETLLVSPLALAWLAWLYMRHEAAFLVMGPRTDLLLIGCGVVTLVPFTLFAAGARRLRLGTIGLVQYLTPTLHFLSGVLIFNEAITRAEIVAFVLIWTGLAIYTVDIVRVTYSPRPVPRTT